MRTQGTHRVLLLNVCTAVVVAVGTAAGVALAGGSGGATAVKATPSVQASPTNPGAATGTVSTPDPVLTPEPSLPPDPNLPPAAKNPWGYDFRPPGHLIYHPLSDFCNYFNCTEDFTTGTGYVVECRDALYSLSGGTPDACIFDGGVTRTLYSHT